MQGFSTYSGFSLARIDSKLRHRNRYCASRGRGGSQRPRSAQSLAYWPLRYSYPFTISSCSTPVVAFAALSHALQHPSGWRMRSPVAAADLVKR